MFFCDGFKVLTFLKNCGSSKKLSEPAKPFAKDKTVSGRTLMLSPKIFNIKLQQAYLTAVVWPRLTCPDRLRRFTKFYWMTSQLNNCLINSKHDGWSFVGNILLAVCFENKEVITRYNHVTTHCFSPLLLKTAAWLQSKRKQYFTNCAWNYFVETFVPAWFIVTTKNWTFLINLPESLGRARWSRCSLMESRLRPSLSWRTPTHCLTPPHDGW